MVKGFDVQWKKSMHLESTADEGGGGRHGGDGRDDDDDEEDDDDGGDEGGEVGVDDESGAEDGGGSDWSAISFEQGWEIWAVVAHDNTVHRVQTKSGLKKVLSEQKSAGSAIKLRWRVRPIYLAHYIRLC